MQEDELQVEQRSETPGESSGGSSVGRPVDTAQDDSVA